MRHQQRDVDAVGQSKAQGGNLAALHRRRERPCPQRAVVALTQQRQHALPKFGQLRVRPLPPEQIAGELLLELPDGPGQRRLGDVALLGGAGEIQRARHRKEVTHLVHFHELRPT